MEQSPRYRGEETLSAAMGYWLRSRVVYGLAVCCNAVATTSTKANAGRTHIASEALSVMNTDRKGGGMESGGSTHDRQWFIVSRWQQYEGEARANLLRIVGIGSFYIIETSTATAAGLASFGCRVERCATGFTLAPLRWRWPDQMVLATLVCPGGRQFFRAAMRNS